MKMVLLLLVVLLALLPKVGLLPSVKKRKCSLAMMVLMLCFLVYGGSMFWIYQRGVYERPMARVEKLPKDLDPYVRGIIISGEKEAYEYRQIIREFAGITLVMPIALLFVWGVYTKDRRAERKVQVMATHGTG